MLLDKLVSFRLFHLFVSSSSTSLMLFAREKTL